ncbi:unnamed protein product, partial [Hermetia illucens]
HSKRIRGLFSVLENIASYNAFKDKQKSYRQQIEPSYHEQYDNSYDDSNQYQNQNQFDKRDEDLYDRRYEASQNDNNQDLSQSQSQSQSESNNRNENLYQSRREYQYEEESKNPFEDRYEENDYAKSTNESLLTEIENFVYSRFHCPNCVDDSQFTNKWTMPLLKLGEKRYYLGIFFKANWFKAAQYCRFHGMHLASISSQEENDRLEKHIRDFGLGHEHFWISGTDLADEGHFFWMANGRPITFTNWNAGEPNNFRYENGEEENCLELWNRDGKGLKWNDSPCSFETYFVCEVQ